MKGCSHSLKNLQLQLVVMFFVVVTQGAFAGPFQNLDFESAVIQAAPPNYVPGDAYDPIDAAAALPFWTVREDNTICNAIWGQPAALDETSVALVDTRYSPIQGNYCVQLYAYADAPSDLFHFASISQVGNLPLGTKTIQFLVSSPPVAGGMIEAVPTVSLNGVAINLFAQSTSGGIVTMVGDVSAFVSSLAELKIQCIGTSGLPGTESENIFDLDGISFSPNSIPEPTCCEMLLLVFGVWLFRRAVWKRNEATEQI